MQNRLSIILTVYNKEPFLRKQFDSLLSQEQTKEGDYEVMVVNDGSTDGSVGIIEEYARQDSRVRVLNQKNQGLSMARNNGVEEAKGDYIWFVDADDVVSPKAVNLICCAITSSPDIIPIYAQTEGEDGIRNAINPNSKTGKEILLEGKWQSCGVFTIFKRSFLIENNLGFYPGIYHEDNEFTPRMLYAAKSVKVIPEVLYTVYHEPNSITQVPRVKRAFDYLTVADSLNHFVEEKHEEGSPVGQVLYQRISIAINNGLEIIVKNSKEEQARFIEVFKGMPQLLKAMKEAKSIKYHIEAFLFKMFPNHCVEVYKTMKLFG